MANERLQDTLLSQGMTPADLAQKLRVDTKTVERWITTGRTPYPKNRHAIAAMLGESESYLWPEALTPEKAAIVSDSEIIKTYSHRNNVAHDLWDRLLANATEQVDILVYVGMFLTEDPNLIGSLRAKAQQGARIRLLFGDPGSREVTRRSADEGIGKNSIAAKIRNALAFFKSLDGEDGVEIGCHATTLYNSIYRYDDEMIINTHVYGVPAPHAPALHLRRLSAGDLFDTYARSFEEVWATAKPPKW